MIRVGRRQLVEAGVHATEHECAEPARRVHARHEARILLARGANRTRLDACRVRERPQDVKRRREAERAAHGGRKTHRGVHFVREKEGDANLVEDTAQGIGIEVKVDTECLDNIRGA